MISPSAIDKFRANLRGSLLQPGEVGYDEARKVWNERHERREPRTRQHGPVCQVAALTPALVLLRSYCAVHLQRLCAPGSHDLSGRPRL